MKTSPTQLRLIVDNPKPPKDAKPKAQRKARLPDDWTPSEPLMAYAEGKGIRGDRLALEIEKFSNHWWANGTPMLNWDACFRKWILNAVSYGGRGGKPYKPPTSIM